MTRTVEGVRVHITEVFVWSFERLGFTLKVEKGEPRRARRTCGTARSSSWREARLE